VSGAARRARALTLAVGLAGCVPPGTPSAAGLPPAGYAAPGAAGSPGYAAPAPPPAAVEAAAGPAAFDPATWGDYVGRTLGLVFDGGHLDFELRRAGGQVIQLARNHYTVPVVIAWRLSQLDNLQPEGPIEGVALLPAAPRPGGVGPALLLATFTLPDPTAHFERYLEFHARLGDPRARPSPYLYALPYGHGLRFSVLQGFHGAFSHHGSNEYAVDFDCPVATSVVAARPGVVVATHAAALGSGTTPEYLDYARVNFVLIAHEDGTLGEYMHLSPSGILVRAGERVVRGQPIALSGNTGYSSTPHLHFQVMTAALDGLSAMPFPFEFATGPDQHGPPVLGHAYAAWE
jgi:murein DD-endopeptidase MepM/ murein hydrolase activator NlpD